MSTRNTFQVKEINIGDEHFLVIAYQDRDNYGNSDERYYLLNEWMPTDYTREREIAWASNAALIADAEEPQ